MPVEVQYTIVHSGKAQIDKLVGEVLATTLKETADISLDESALKLAISVRYSLHVDNDRKISGISVRFDLDNNVDDLVNFTNDFCKSLGSKESVEHVIKFSDPLLFQVQKQLVEEIYQIEMKLREALTIIFIKTYGNNYYNLLTDSVVKPLDELANQQHMQYVFENEFFFLLFSDYIRINIRKPIKFEDLLRMIQQTNDFSSFRNELISQPISDDNYSAFIASLMSNLKPIEDLRNCIAHNRAFAHDTIGNYEMAKEKLLSELEDFFEKISE